MRYLHHAFIITIITLASPALAEPKPEQEADDFEYGKTIHIPDASAQEKAAACKKFEGRYIGYYSHVYRVENCLRREITSEKTLQTLSQKAKITTVSAKTIQLLKPGTAISDITSPRSCQFFEGKYVIYSSSDIYHIKKCKKHLLPDYETYLEHRNSSKASTKILEINTQELQRFKAGPPIPSIMDQVFADLAQLEKEVDIIPLKEACKGLEGRIATYYSKIYEIKKCRKHEILTPRSYLKKNQATAKPPFPEMTSEQWLSIPSGKPLKGDNWQEADILPVEKSF